MRSTLAASKRSVLYSIVSRNPSGTSVAKRVKSNFEVRLKSSRGVNNKLRRLQGRQRYVLKGEHHLEQRRATCVAIAMGCGHKLFEREFLMGVSLDRRSADPAEQLAESGIAR